MAERFNRSSADDVLLEDSQRTRLVDTGIPDILGVDDDHRAMPALVHATRMIDPHDTLQSVFGGALLQRLVHLLRSLRRARLSRRADEDVVAILAHQDV